MDVRSDYKYTSTHEWIKVEGDVATIGITDHAQAELGDVVYVDLPNVGRAVAAGDTVGSVESVKAVSDIYSPVSGEIVEVNDSLGSQSELVNTAPYDNGFMFKVRLSNTAELDGLLSAEAYSAANE